MHFSLSARKTISILRSIVISGTQQFELQCSLQYVKFLDKKGQTTNTTNKWVGRLRNSTFSHISNISTLWANHFWKNSTVLTNINIQLDITLNIFLSRNRSLISQNIEMNKFFISTRFNNIIITIFKEGEVEKHEVARRHTPIRCTVYINFEIKRDRNEKYVCATVLPH